MWKTKTRIRFVTMAMGTRVYTVCIFLSSFHFNLFPVEQLTLLMPVYSIEKPNFYSQCKDVKKKMDVSILASSKHKIDTSSCSPLHYLTLLYFISLSHCSSLKPAFCLSLPPLHLTVQSLLEASSIVNIVLLECTTLPLLRSFVMTFRELQTHHPSFLSGELWFLNDLWEEIYPCNTSFNDNKIIVFAG